jgi:hypothetical protein
MRFEDKDDGEFRIHAGTLEPRQGQGHLASVIVTRSLKGQVGLREIYRDLEVSGGHRWLTSDEALKHALELGARAITAEKSRPLSQTSRGSLEAAGVSPLPERHPVDLDRPLSMQGHEHV